MDFWKPVFFVLASHFVSFFIAQCHGDNGIIDVQWPISFIIGCLSATLIRVGKGWKPDTRTIIVNILIGIWGLRMAFHIFRRIEYGKEDRRFAKLRQLLYEKGGKVLYYVVAFCGIFMTNGLIICVINSPGLYICMKANKEPLNFLDGIGMAVWLIGFLIVLVADEQLRAFQVKRDAGETNGERLCKTGLWSWSRHPNYFGEAVLWWGIFMMACNIEYGWVTFYAPLLLFLTLRFGSGVPMVEDLYKDDDEFIRW